MRSFLNSFRFAFRGSKQLLITERNFRIHILCALLVLLIGTILNFSYIEKLIFLVLIGGVLAFEAMNSALERSCDAKGLDFDFQKQAAKDQGAASAAIFSGAAVIIFVFTIAHNFESQSKAISAQWLSWPFFIVLFLVNFLLILKPLKKVWGVSLMLLSMLCHFFLALHMNDNFFFLFLSWLAHGSLIFSHTKNFASKTT